MYVVELEADWEKEWSKIAADIAALRKMFADGGLLIRVLPSNPQFGSLNLGAAIQVVAYEWRQALGGFPVVEHTPAPQRADAAQVAGMLGHWEQALAHIGFLDPAAPKKLMPRLNQLFNRSQLTAEEIHILRGVAKAMLQSTPPKR